MGVDVTQWRAAVGTHAGRVRPAVPVARTRYGAASGCYPYRFPSDTEPLAILKALRQHHKFGLVAECILPADSQMRKEFFNGLVGFLLLLEAGIERNPGPAGDDESRDESKAKRLKSANSTTRRIDSFFRPASTSVTGPCTESVPAPGSSSFSSPMMSPSPSPSPTPSPSPMQSPSPAPSSTISDPEPTQPIGQPPGTSSASSYWVANDIGDCIGKGETISDHKKYQLLENPWRPPPDYDLPFSSTSMKNKDGTLRKRYLNQGHLDKYRSWLVLSHRDRGLYCKYCALFSVSGKAGHNKAMRLGKLVSEPLTNFKKLVGKDGHLDCHESLKYHKEAVEAGKEFMLIYHKPELQVASRINQQRVDEIKSNRERLEPIIRACMFLGRQGLAFRGHRDDGELYPEKDELFRKNVNSAVCNQGNFREVLRLMTQSGDERLKRHLMTSSARATYVGKNTQNGLINCIGDEILESILQKVRSAEYFAIMFDETSDISHKSQLSLVIRYVTSAGQVHESFVGFIDTFDDILETEKKQNEAEQDDEQEEERREPATETKLTGEAIGLIVIRMLQKLRLNLDKCIGIATDNCSVMVSELKGAVQEIQKYARNALRTPCFSHKLNLSLSKSNQVISIRNAIGTMKSCDFF
ncbi:uncharacterized protein LOC124371012 [Homalodisca vitripennis]|uniref:uncharacterized protein LOC124371012 n=1 Tax=Homalodisca vitripennis TaxID=197043 RepID=UPI001EEBA550|nr:uncharacterized protein LOC124371012 [Homalodisca vitripennis]